MKRNDLTAEFVRSVLNYDQLTGLFRWAIDRGRIPKNRRADYETEGRCKVMIDRKIYMAHRLAWIHVTGEWPKHQIDHIDGDATNNRFINLRDVPQTINAQNRVRARGYQINKWGKFVASIKAPVGGYLNLGSYETADEAHDAYLRAKRRLHPGCTT